MVPSNVAPWDEVRTRLNNLLRGWATYFSYGTRLMAYRAADHHVYEAVRGFPDAAPQGAFARHTAILGPCGLWRAGRAPATPDAHWRAADSCEMKPVGERMREIRTSGSMSGDGKRGDAMPDTAPVLDSTSAGWNCNWHRYNNEYGRACLLAGKTAVQALSGRRKGLIGRAWRGQLLHRSGRAQDQRAADQSAKQGRVGTVGGERQLDPARGFLDPHRDLQQP